MHDGKEAEETDRPDQWQKRDRGRKGYRERGEGRIRVNSKPIHIMEPELARRKALEPVQIAEAMNRLSTVDINVDVAGGGIMGQVDAVRTAIARGLVHFNDGGAGIDEELRDEFLRFDRTPLVNDPDGKSPSTKWAEEPEEVAEIVQVN